MKKLIWLSPCLALSACAATAPSVAPSAAPAAPAVASAGATGAACGATNYAYLVGRPMTDAREISDRDYRLAAGGAEASRANRITLTYDATTQRITDIRCG